ncbi:AMP-binding protein [Rhodococcus opacus]|nr:AMP-binding protein [Rhodococcus opacus]
MTPETVPVVCDAYPAWRPSEREIGRSRLLGAMRRWGIADLTELHRRSVAEPEWFWRAVILDLDITFSTPFTAVLDDSRGKPLPRWFVGGRMNVAELCVHRHAAGSAAERTAVVYEGDRGERRSMTFGELDRAVRDFAGRLTALGVEAGDRVILFLPVVPEAVVAFLACAMVGAISVPAFTGFGSDALASRIDDSEASLIVTADAASRRGRVVPLKQTVDEALREPNAVRSVVVLRHLGEAVPMTSGRDLYWDDLPSPERPAEVREMDSNEPLTIIYTSGTTGRPKGVVHSHAGFAVKAATDFAYGFDVGSDDVIAWIADMGWMLGPLLIMGGLQLGATLVLTEGVPDHPTPLRLWEIAERNGVTLQGIAPTAARAMRADGAVPRRDLPLRAFVSTGEAWDEPTWRWLFDGVGGSKLPIMNYSGGTEVGGGILVGFPFLDMLPAGFNGPLPGMDVAVLDELGRPVTGQVGELAILNTWPGMTHAFWKDERRYLETYWSRWQQIWVHGDLAARDERGNWKMHGRSDDTIKVSGRRVGPAELETALLCDDRIREVAVIGVPNPQRGQHVVAFVVTDDGSAHDDLVATAMRNVGRAFAPEVHLVTTLPKTKNGKIMRRAIRGRHLGTSLGDLSALDPATRLDDIPRRGGDPAGEEK